MTYSAAHSASMLMPRTAPGAGELLWGEAPRKQPIAQLVLMAVVLLLVAAPTALAGGGGSANPITLMRQVADSTWELTGLMQASNESLEAIDGHSAQLGELQTTIGSIADSSAGMAAKTTQLDTKLGSVSGAVKQSRGKLERVDGRLATTAASMAGLRRSVGGSAASTATIVREFGGIDAAITSMNTNLQTAIAEMAKSAPLTRQFAANATRTSIAGGTTSRYDVPNYAPNTKVMTVMLGMIKTMQEGGRLSARKDSHEASNPVVGMALKLQVPDGTNVGAIVQPFDGTYGLPDANYFVTNKIWKF